MAKGTIHNRMPIYHRYLGFCCGNYGRLRHQWSGDDFSRYCSTLMFSLGRDCYSCDLVFLDVYAEDNDFKKGLYFTLGGIVITIILLFV